MSFISVFDVLGPNMIGPSSSVPNESCVMYSATMMAQIGPLGSPASVPKIMYRKGSAVMMEPPGAPGDATMAMPSVMMNGMTVPMEIGS